MASLFKKTFAVVMAVALVFTCLTVNAASEGTSINVSTAYSSNISETVTVELHTRNFGAVYGSDFTIKLPDGFEVATDVQVKSGKSWDKDSNYVVSENKNTIRFLDVRTTEGFDISFGVAIPAGKPDDTYEISIINGTFIDAYEADYSVKTSVGAIVVRTDTNTEFDGTTEGYFIPYGSVKDDSGKFVDKNEDGSFDNGVVSKSFKLPEASVGVTTFGASSRPADEDKGISKGIQLGSYAVNTVGKKYGTLMIMGDDTTGTGTYADFRAAQSHLTDEQIYSKLAEMYFNAKPSDGTIKVTYANKTKYIIVGCVAQTKYMWKGEVNKVPHLQYAVRAINPGETRTYTAVAYNYAEDSEGTLSAYVFSKEIKVDAKYKEQSAN